MPAAPAVMYAMRMLNYHETHEKKGRKPKQNAAARTALPPLSFFRVFRVFRGLFLGLVSEFFGWRFREKASQSCAQGVDEQHHDRRGISDAGRPGQRWHRR